ncbi:membrane bound O-acyl transferase MBOAT family protein [[Leptolyngbya] sp. PCC 7376]|uniref:MBOAT family O-acyltransferase n=1 Tax=[Leptolyngbya] sp. PCC 7376 TaxID=111781 RepID=UPI00029EE9BC|nr:MBOAT family O-acyltransferase [[Leptolyngbya] sp. PCC 7376]AFY38097.1 membrane bound O-acyl transferase MBOAT family protein [[Leptolyngbya] sp. PCC 7376]
MKLVSFSYACFLLGTLICYWGLGTLLPTLRVWILLIASLGFYALLQPQFLPLLLGLTTVNYIVGRLIYAQLRQSERLKKSGRSPSFWNRQALYLLILGVFLNLFILFGFKYVPFTLENLNTFLDMPWATDVAMVLEENLIAPVGISFFTFECISYLVDVYRGAPATLSFSHFSSYKLFFPKILSGPISRFHYFDNQTKGKPHLFFDQGVEGLWLIASGAFKKVLIADNLGVYVELCVNNLDRAGSGDLWLFVIAYGLQLYFDFSGYVDLAMGSAKLLGFNLPVNFDFPYFSTSLADFWRRWHMSLGEWLRNYLYFPLGGSRQGLMRTCFNLFLVMFLAGIWHGAAWGYVLWGCIHGAGLAIHRLGDAIARKFSLIKRFWESIPGTVLAWGITQILVFMAWIPFRLPDGQQANLLLSHFWKHQGDIQFGQKIYFEGLNMGRSYFVLLLGLISIGMGLAYLIQRRWQLNLNWALKLAFVPLCFYVVWIFAPEGNVPYIYFDF